MENQHRKITGYRELNEFEIMWMNAIKEHGKNLGSLVEGVEALSEADLRAVALAKTHLQTGLMWLTRAIAKPEFF